MGICTATSQCCECQSPFYIPPLIQLGGTWSRRNEIPTWFVILRVTMVLAMLGITGVSLYVKFDDGEIGWYLIWLTNWAQILNTITVIVRFASTITVKYQHMPLLGDYLEALPLSLQRLYSFQCVLSRTALPTTSLVAFNYWIYVYGGDDVTDRTLKAVDQIQMHGGNCLLLWMDHVLSAEVFHHRSAIWSVLFCTLYQVRNLIFELIIGENEKGELYLCSATESSADWKTVLMYYVVGVVTVTIFNSMAVSVKNILLRLSTKWTKANWSTAVPSARGSMAVYGDNSDDDLLL